MHRPPTVEYGSFIEKFGPMNSRVVFEAVTVPVFLESLVIVLLPSSRILFFDEYQPNGPVSSVRTHPD